MREKIVALYRDSLFRNSFYLMLSTAVMAVFGFVFWVVCSHLYTPADVGLATSLISASSLMTVLSALGFTNVIIRFLPGSERKNEQISTAFILTAIASVIASIGFLLWAFLTKSPTVQSIHPGVLIAIFILYVVILTVNAVLESAFIAYRASKYVVLKNTILSCLKLALLFFVISFGFIGIVGAIVLATVIAFSVGFFWLVTNFKYHLSLHIDKETIEETKHFAAGNYLGNLFGSLPTTVLPLIVLSRLGAQEAAFFYMPTMIVALLNVIPSSTAQSLFAEVSHNEAGLVRYLTDATKHLFLLLVPAVVATWLLGGFVLKFFGATYAAAGTLPLMVLALSSLIGALNYFGDTLLNIKKRIGLYIFMNAFNALIIVILAYYAAPHGLVAIAIASVIGQILTLILYFSINWQLVSGHWATRNVS